MHKTFALILILPLLASCWRPGERDPTRYPWDQPVSPAPVVPLAPPAAATGAKEVYCVVAVEPSAASGIIVGGGKQNMSPECAELATQIRPRSESPRPEIVAAPTNGGAVAGLSGSSGMVFHPARSRADADFRRQCDALPAKLVDLQRRFDLELAGGVGQMARSAWDNGGRTQWSSIRWTLAWNASCSMGQRARQRVTLRDLDGQVLAYQMISTENVCAGDHATLSPDDTEYGC